MKQEEAQKLKGKQIRLLLNNGYRYHGIVIELAEDTVIILDKFQDRVSIKLSDISVCTEVQNG